MLAGGIHCITLLSIPIIVRRSLGRRARPFILPWLIFLVRVNTQHALASGEMRTCTMNFHWVAYRTASVEANRALFHTRLTTIRRVSRYKETCICRVRGIRQKREFAVIGSTGLPPACHEKYRVGTRISLAPSGAVTGARTGAEA